MELVLDHSRGAIFPTLLQLPLSILFTQVMGVVQRAVELDNVSFPIRVLCLLLAICLTGVGAAMTLRAKLVANPSDGFVKAVSERIGRPLGFTKNLLDICSVGLAAALSLLLLGKLVGVGAGSVACMLLTGRVIDASHFLWDGIGRSDSLDGSI